MSDSWEARMSAKAAQRRIAQAAARAAAKRALTPEKWGPEPPYDDGPCQEWRFDENHGWQSWRICGFTHGVCGNGVDHSDEIWLAGAV